jgi:tetratricopeptide (TPR) repeat protein
VRGDADPETARTTLLLAAFENDQTRVAEAAALLAEARAAIDPRTALAVEIATEEAHALSRLGRRDEAATRAEEALARARAIWGERHPTVANALNLLGAIERDRGRIAESERAYSASLALARELYGAKHPQLARTLYNQGMLFQFDFGRPADAEPLYREAVEIHRAAFGDPLHPTLGIYLRGWGRGLVGVGRAGEALARLREANAIFRRIEEGETDVASTESEEAWALLELGRAGEARALLDRALPVLEAAYGADHRIVRRARERLARARAAGAGASVSAPPSAREARDR